MGVFGRNAPSPRQVVPSELSADRAALPAAMIGCVLREMKCPRIVETWESAVVPISVTTASEHRGLQRLAAAYGIVIERSSRLLGGSENVTYFLQSAQRAVVVTVLLKKDEIAAREYSDYLVSLYANDFRVPRIIARSDGGYVTPYGIHSALLCEHVEGRRYLQLPKRYLPQVGAELARLHSSDVVRCDLRPCLRVRLDDIGDFGPDPDHDFVHWAWRWHERVRYIVDLPVSAVPTHGDVFADNLLVDRQDNVVFIDWEDGARDGLWVDLSTALLGLCAPGEFRPARAHLLLTAYAKGSAERIDLAGLRDATVYAAVYAAVHRYRRRAQLPAALDAGRSYRALEAVVDSLMSNWDSAVARL